MASLYGTLPVLDGTSSFKIDSGLETHQSVMFKSKSSQLMETCDLVVLGALEVVILQVWI